MSEIVLFEEFLGVLGDELKRATSQNGNLSLLLIAPDPDPDKPAENPGAGSSSIMDLVDILRDQAAMEGRFVSFGYERLAVIFFRLELKDALAQAEKARIIISGSDSVSASSSLASAPAPAPFSMPSLSMGFSAFPDNGILAEELADAALEALDRAQKQGGDCLVLADQKTG